ncbi:hypothetical protein EZV73_23770 [Acidaminobacter sp. JC074]|uniref:sensor histidine kinase n=1 Tax=Acidaminobacter sp. JC074 TaxID=2530199 RepID=UPI001F0E186B|nr:histidine kinase [Acidaminobacter sp. JC074]MCH4890621.1 hypothetical protein [Acidaminobacter sp. JC074]
MVGNKKSLFYVSLLYRLSTIMLMFSMILAEDLYKSYSLNDPFLIILSVSSIIILFIYNQVHTHRDVVRYAVFIETASLLAIYFFTGGLYSPIIWLIVNPAVFYMFYYRESYFLPALILLFSIATSLGPYIIGSSFSIEAIMYLPGLFLSIMMFVILSVLSRQYSQNLNRKDTLLAVRKTLSEERKTNHILRESLFNAYSLVDRLLLIEDEEEGVDEIFSYITSDLMIDGFFIVKDVPDQVSYYSSDEIKSLVENKTSDYHIETYELEGDSYYGYLGIVYLNENKAKALTSSIQIELLVKLSTLFMDRNQFRNAYKKLLINEEQRRIAAEMHDGVKQDIHGITYFIYNILNTSDSLEKEEIIDKLKFIYEAISETTTELRKTIYKLNDTSGQVKWTNQIQTVCNRLKSQYNIDMTIDYKNDVDDLDMSVAIIEAMKRCLKEATANAVEHGKASRVDVDFSKVDSHLRLVLINDGLPVERDKEPGLGIRNMKKLAMVHKGDFSLDNLDDHGVKMELSLAYEG